MQIYLIAHSSLATDCCNLYVPLGQVVACFSDHNTKEFNLLDAFYYCFLLLSEKFCL